MEFTSGGKSHVIGKKLISDFRNETSSAHKHSTLPTSAHKTIQPGLLLHTKPFNLAYFCT